MPSAPRSEPVRLVNVCLLLWGGILVGLALPYAIEGRSWVIAGFSVGAITMGLAVWGLRRAEWVRPMFASLYLLAVGCVVAGTLTDVDVYSAAGCVSLTVLSVGGAILHRLGAR